MELIIEDVRSRRRRKEEESSKRTVMWIRILGW